MNSLESEVMLTLSKRLDYIERGGGVQRMHTIPTLAPQNVAAHSFGVAWWCWLLSHDNQPSVDLLMAALQHDLPEQVTGDIPSPAKSLLNINSAILDMEFDLNSAAELPPFEKLISESELRVLKMADTLELMQHCIREKQLGSRCPQLLDMFKNIKRYAMGLSRTNFESKIIVFLADKWSEI